MEKIRLFFYIQCFFLFAGNDVKINDLELHFYKVFRYKCFCKKTLLEKYLLVKGLKVLSEIFNLWSGRSIICSGHLILPRIFPVGGNVWCVFHLVGQFLILVRHCPMFDRHFKV